MKTREKRDLIFKVVFSFPAFIIYTMFMIAPVVFSAYYSLNKWNGVGPMKFVGLDNFKSLLRSSDFIRVNTNTLTLVFFSLIITIPMTAIIAYLIYRTFHGFKFFRFVVFIPVIVSAVIIGLIFAILFNADFGPLNQFLEALHIPTRAWLSDPDTVLYAVIVPQLWQSIGYYTIILLAGMQSVSQEVLDSATIDGANSLQIFTRIMLPLIAEISQIVVILVVTGALKSFGFSWSMTSGGPGVQSTYLAVYMYTKAFIESNFGKSSAVSLTILLYAVVFTVIFKKIYSYFLDD